jgi:subtilisin family serine protease
MTQALARRMVFALATVWLVLPANALHAQPLRAPDKLPYAKLDSTLAQIALAVDREQSAEALVVRLGSPLARPGAIPVSVRTSDVEEMLAWLRSDDTASVANVAPGVVEAYVHPATLRQLDSLPFVQRVSQIFPPQELMVSQGVTVHGAGSWQARGYVGEGVKVGIIDSFQGFSALRGSELPATVVARCYSAIGSYSALLDHCETGSSHGTAVAETVIDVAPGAQLYIANPISALDTRTTVDWMTSQGVRVINYSMARVWDGPGDGTSPYYDSPLHTVNAAVSSGALFVAAAGNHAAATYLGPFVDHDADRWAEFGGTEHNVVALPAGANVIIQVRWEDTWSNANRDLDLVLFDTADNIVAVSTAVQDGRPGATPFEALSYRASFSGTFYIRVYHRSGVRPAWIQLQNFSQHSLGYYSRGGSIVNPAESPNPGLLAVGAAAWYDTETLEWFSSKGPTPDGRTKPDLVGADRGDTVTYGFSGFAGTSQAAPHVSGLAALVLQAFPTFTPSQIGTYLRSFAAARDMPVPNTNWGSGLATLPAPRETRSDDFDGDGRSDVAIFRPSDGGWYFLPSGSSAGRRVQWGEDSDIPVPGDYDGDHTADIAVYRPSTGMWYIVQSTGTTRVVQWGAVGDIPAPADFDGDGRTDPTVFRPSTGRWYQLRSVTGFGYGVNWGLWGDVPVPADYDGDGRADPAVYRPSEGRWYELWSSTGFGHGALWGGIPGDIPLAGDYDGDGKADPTVFRPADGSWYQLRSVSGSGFRVLWGVSGDLPVVGDYDGDGRADPTVFRPSTGRWYQLRSTTGTGFGVTWGGTGDKPL